MKRFDVWQGKEKLGEGVQWGYGGVSVEWTSPMPFKSDVGHYESIDTLYALQENPFDFTFKSEIRWLDETLTNP